MYPLLRLRRIWKIQAQNKSIWTIWKLSAECSRKLSWWHSLWLLLIKKRTSLYESRSMCWNSSWIRRNRSWCNLKRRKPLLKLFKRIFSSTQKGLTSCWSKIWSTSRRCVVWRGSCRRRRLIIRDKLRVWDKKCQSIGSNKVNENN